MSWEAANAPNLSAATGYHQNHDQQQYINGGDRHRISSSETIEAALSRLSRAYNNSIECIGAINKTNQMILQRERMEREQNQQRLNDEQGDMTTKDSALGIIERVSVAARITLETAILLDPLILPYIPSLHQSMIEMCYDDYCGLDSTDTNSTQTSRWNIVKERRALPPTISSAAHKSTLIKLCYLSLVNYSDLLQISCCCNTTTASASKEILDRGIVPKLKSLQNQRQRVCCWKSEVPEATKRLAVAALCDASNLDATDPMVWLKLASTSRSLERIVAERDDSTVERSHHRRLQRHALERGTVALPSHMPPNRTVTRALEEFRREPEPKEYFLKRDGTNNTRIISKTVELTRYSWSMLGRIIIRACKGDESAAMESASQWEFSSTESLFGSPVIVLKLSPMLVLPSKVLGKICQYLENTSIWNFEATCRALSVNIIAARASMEESDEVVIEKQKQQRQEEQHDNRNQSQKQKKQQLIKESSPVELVVDDQRGLTVGLQDRGNSYKGHEHQQRDHSTSSDSMNTGDKEATKEKKIGTESSTSLPIPARQSFRTSQRLRCQQISTGKKQDRAANRKSLNYCFVAATLSCTENKHDEIADRLQESNKFNYVLRGKENPLLISSQNDSSYQGASNEMLNTNFIEAKERISVASLPAFVKKWSSKNSGPMDLLEGFLAHVALYTEDVFTSDSHTTGLHSCIISSFQLLLLRSGSHQSIVPRFFQPVTETGSILRTLETFAMDLLHAELILKQCDRHSPKIVEFDDDANFVSLMAPALLESCIVLKQGIDAFRKNNGIDNRLFLKFYSLQIRCYWLTASFYLWRSKIARAIFMSREAEDEGIRFIGMTIKCFDSPFLHSNESVRTPHLVSPGRQDVYWREISPVSLTKFRDEIQASSVVSYARQRFQELVSQLEKVEDSEKKEISMNDASVLAEIGQKLFERYNSQYGSSDSKLSELVENFLVICGGDLALLQEKSSEIYYSIQIKHYTIADLQLVSNSSILSMLITCLNMDKENRLSVVQLLSRLVLTVRDHHILLLKQISAFRATRKQTDGLSDSDDDMSDDEPNSSQKDDHEKKARQCGHLIKLLIDSLRIATLPSYLSQEEISILLLSDEFIDMVESTLDFSNKWFQSTVRYLSIPDDAVDQDIFRSLHKLLIKSQNIPPDTASNNLEFVFFRGLVHIIISQQVVLKMLVTSQVDRANRNARQRLCVQRAQFIGLVASQLGALLSLNLAHVDDFVLRKGPLFEHYHLQESNTTNSRVLNCEEEILFLHTVRWLRNYTSQGEWENLNNSADNVCSSFDKPIIKELKIPISTVIIGLCGSSSCSRKPGDQTQIYIKGDHENDPLSINEFFDTDASINDWQSDNEEDIGSEKRKKELLRVICHAIHCIILIFESVDEKDIAIKLLENNCSAKSGPLLPLVATRVLNFFADTLLLNFGHDETDGKNRKLLWSEQYSYRTKHTGELLDAALHKAYRWLYGFVLIGEKNHQLNAGSELSHSVNTINEIAAKNFKLESTVAAGQLYRCIVRAYAGGRRMPPKAALELVSAALPFLRESEQSKALRGFALSGDNVDLNINSLLNVDEQWNSPFTIVRDSITVNKDSSDVSVNTTIDEFEAMQVRRGLSKQLALGPLPVVSSDPRSKSETGVDDDRTQTIRNEKAIANKFNAILDDLCLSDADNWEGWYRASQCCTMKADAIADRLGLTLGFSRIKDFSVPMQRTSSQRGIDISKLKDEQEKEEMMLKQAMFLGHDFSLFMNNAWSSFSSLRNCIATLKKGSKVEIDVHSGRKKSAVNFWAEIDSKYDEGNFLEWQEACGGIFVSALRNLSVRLNCVALYIIQSKSNNSSEDHVLMSEMCESLGNAFYSELMASQNYGWPMRTVTSKKKRDLAVMANVCFQAAIKHADDSVETDDDNENHCTWDLLFMIGKCDEKIAGTYNQQAFVKQTEAEPCKTRLYEDYMGAAILVYSQALLQVTKLEEAGGQLQAGGSGHGSTEILYRLHASRLKCLIHAVSRNEEERGHAELEALRLTEKCCFKELDSKFITKKDIRERIWIVLADVVDGLAECRRLKPFFHRSVYRHAQALMWSPVFYDPASNNGSMDIVPATRGCQITGLDNSKPVVYSAENVISTLFDKRRTQLVAVWVTTSGPTSPFQVLNTTIRKYDSLRGKYIAAYLETLKLCKFRFEIETFLKWLYASKRDLPSYFQSGAINGCDKPVKTQIQDPLLIVGSNKTLMSQGLLVSSKRKANSALADLLIDEMSSKAGVVSNKSASSMFDQKKISESYLKNSYACYLRLHCTTQDLEKVRVWNYSGYSVREVDALCQAYLWLGDTSLDGLTAIDKIEYHNYDWTGGSRNKSIFKVALAKCRTLFPCLSVNFFDKTRPSVKNKRGKSSQTPDPDESTKPGLKRKSPSNASITQSVSSTEKETKKKSFEVAVPKGLTSGDTFLTTVKVGDSDAIKIQLTVPDGETVPSTLRFNLNVPKTPPRKGHKKQRYHLPEK